MKAKTTTKNRRKLSKGSRKTPGSMRLLNRNLVTIPPTMSTEGTNTHELNEQDAMRKMIEQNFVCDF